MNDKLQQLKSELETDETSLRRYRERLRLIKLTQRRKPDAPLLHREYEIIQTELNKRYFSAIHKTPSEENVAEMIRQATKLKIIQSCWIGNRCIDVFVPNICASALPQFSNQRTMKGLALEIDGPIHDNQL